MTKQTISKPSNLLFIFTLLLSLFTIVSCSSDKEEMDEKAKAAVEEITAPVGEVSVADSSSDMSSDAAGAAPAAAGGKGKETYDGVCFACHAQGLAGAPILGDKEAWAARLEKR